VTTRCNQNPLCPVLLGDAQSCIKSCLVFTQPQYVLSNPRSRSHKVRLSDSPPTGLTQHALEACCAAAAGRRAVHRHNSCTSISGTCPITDFAAASLVAKLDLTGFGENPACVRSTESHRHLGGFDFLRTHQCPALLQSCSGASPNTSIETPSSRSR
jgi:hypothetical protein